MERKKARIDRATICGATETSKQFAREVVKKVEEFQNYKVDKDTEECAYCATIGRGRVGCAAITHRPCGICGTDMSFSNTCTDVICPSCAKENKLCKHCGGDIEMKQRRKPRPYEGKDV